MSNENVTYAKADPNPNYSKEIYFTATVSILNRDVAISACGKNYHVTWQISPQYHSEMDENIAPLLESLLKTHYSDYIYHELLDTYIAHLNEVQEEAYANYYLDDEIPPF